MNKSESITKLAIALVKFNGEISKISKDANNPFFKNKYATLDSIIDAARPILTQNGLSILQLPAGDGEHAIMKTLLLHESGEWIESEPLIMKPVKNDPQAYGSCITYMRRYSLTSFLSLNTGEDDDGNGATYEKDKPQKPLPKTNEGRPTDLISKERQDILIKVVGKDITAAKKVMLKYNYTSSDKIQNFRYDTIIDEIKREIQAITK